MIMASARLCWAVTVAGSLIWVYGLSVFTFYFLSETMGDKFFPQAGKKVLFTCFASFWGSIYLLFFWLLCPFAALENFLLLMIVPLFCAGANLHKFDSFDITGNVSEAVAQAAVLSALLIIFAIIREPLAYCSLSLPGTYKGMVLIFQFNDNAFFPIRIFISSAGALILLGYFISIYQNIKNSNFPGER